MKLNWNLSGSLTSAETSSRKTGRRGKLVERQNLRPKGRDSLRQAVRAFGERGSKQQTEARTGGADRSR